MPDSELIHRCSMVIESHVRTFEQDIGRLHAPAARGERRRIPGSPFHVYPELFFQITGTTTFTLPEEQFTLRPGDIGIIPRLLPHAERVAQHDGQPFSNLVMMLSVETVSFHIAAESPGKRGVPYVFQAQRFDSADCVRLAESLDEIAALAWQTAPDDALARRTLSHLVLGFLYKLLVLLRDGNRVSVTGHSKVVGAKNQIALNISNPALSVKALADWLRCSPDYLSSLFHADTGETLVRYITRNRVLMAKSLLRKSDLTVSEIAWACGYHDAAYFCRVFRTYAAVSPGEFRAGERSQDA